jgi:hypothetical protein
MTWTEPELCQLFFISGATGSSKTQSEINTLAATFLRSFPRCSAIFLDVKGVVHRDVAGLAKWTGREEASAIALALPRKTLQDGGRRTPSI